VSYLLDLANTLEQAVGRLRALAAAVDSTVEQAEPPTIGSTVEDKAGAADTAAAPAAQAEASAAPDSTPAPAEPETVGSTVADAANPPIAGGAPTAAELEDAFTHQRIREAFEQRTRHRHSLDDGATWIEAE
jgi:hypothetical protein